ncbi:MAG: YjgN family protein [Pseudomonadota bacterium]
MSDTSSGSDERNRIAGASADSGSTDAPAAASPQWLPFRFSGDGASFFRLWIVNLALTLVTLGIYSAWAKVRTNRYFYGHTSVAGSAFEYHAEPLVILRGRLIAVGVLVAYTLISNFFPLFGLLVLLALMVMLPFIVVRSMRFNAQMTSWRGIRMRFLGEVDGAFGAYIGWPTLGLFSMGLLWPFAWFKKAEFGVNNHRLGATPFRMTATAGSFYRLAMMFTLISVPLFLLFGWLAADLFGPLLDAAAEAEDTASSAEAEALVLGPLYVVLFVGYLLLFSLFSGLRFITIYRRIELGDNAIETDLSIWRFLWVSVSNTVLIVLTLGLFYPWARVRMTRLLIESLEAEAHSLDGFVAASLQDETALGDELGEVMDFGIGV